MGILLTDNPLLSDFLTSCLKLRFNQTDNLSIICEKCLDRSENLCQRDEGNIDRGETNLVLDIVRSHIADVCLLHADHTRIIAKFPRQLSMSYIDRKHLDRAILQHTVGKSACGRADIHTDLLIQRHSEMRHRLLQFQTSAAHIF